jgi:hypothetical protein
MLQEFEDRKKELKDRLLLSYAELCSDPNDEGDLESLKGKARALSRALGEASTSAELKVAEAGILSILADASRMRTAVEFG